MKYIKPNQTNTQPIELTRLNKKNTEKWESKSPIRETQNTQQL